MGFEWHSYEACIVAAALISGTNHVICHPSLVETVALVVVRHRNVDGLKLSWIWQFVCKQRQTTEPLYSVKSYVPELTSEVQGPPGILEAVSKGPFGSL